MDTYTFRFLVRTGIDNSVIGSGEGKVEANSGGEAAPLAIDWALANNPYAEPKYDPWIQLMELRKLDEGDCGRCWKCLPNHQFMIVCVECGNKRCPKAADHNNECTGSNDLGQPGSAYEFGAGEASAIRFQEFFAAPKEEQ